MPTNLVKTAADERRWSKAKNIASQSGRGDNYAYIVGIYKRMTRRNPWYGAAVIIDGVLDDLDHTAKTSAVSHADFQERADRARALYKWLDNHRAEMKQYAEEQWDVAVASEPAQVVRRPPFEVQSRQIDSYDEFARLYQEAWEMVKKYTGQAGAQTGLERMALLSDLYPEWEDQLIEGEAYKAEAMEPSIDFSAVDRGKAPSDDESGVKWTYDSVTWMRPWLAGENERLVEIRRGDAVDAWLSKGKWHHGEVTGISQAKDQIKVGGVWFDRVLVYSLAERGPGGQPGEAVGEPKVIEHDPTQDWLINGTVEVTDPKPRAQWINIDVTLDTPHGEWKTNYAYHKRERRWARGKIPPSWVIREAMGLSEVLASRVPDLPETGFGEVGLLSDKYGWVVVAAPDDSEWINILHLVKGEDKPREYGFNKSQQRWARRTVPPGDLREEIKKAGWKVK